MGGAPKIKASHSNGESINPYPTPQLQDPQPSGSSLSPSVLQATPEPAAPPDCRHAQHAHSPPVHTPCPPLPAPPALCQGGSFTIALLRAMPSSLAKAGWGPCWSQTDPLPTPGKLRCWVTAGPSHMLRRPSLVRFQTSAVRSPLLDPRAGLVPLQ